MKATWHSAALVIAFAAALAMSGCAGTRQPETAFNTDDVLFAHMMIVHHQQSAEMASLVPARSADPELAALAVAINTTQQTESSTLTGWLITWNQPTAQPGGHSMPGMTAMPGMISELDMAMLEGGTGPDFDFIFAREMIAHHNGAIQMAQNVVQKGVSPPVRRLAAAMVVERQAQVRQLQTIMDRV